MDTRDKRSYTGGLTPEEIETAAALLRRLEPGFLPFPLFLEMCRLTTMPTVELVVFRRLESGTVQTHLRRRSEEDLLWPNKWCNPGCIIRPTDTLSSAMERLRGEDLCGAAFIDEPVFVTALIHADKRGQTAPHVFWVELNGEPSCGEYFDVASLPADFISEQQYLVDAALADYHSRHSLQ